MGKMVLGVRWRVAINRAVPAPPKKPMTALRLTRWILSPARSPAVQRAAERRRKRRRRPRLPGRPDRNLPCRSNVRHSGCNSNMVSSLRGSNRLSSNRLSSNRCSSSMVNSRVSKLEERMLSLSLGLGISNVHSSSSSHKLGAQHHLLSSRPVAKRRLQSLLSFSSRDRRRCNNLNSHHSLSNKRNNSSRGGLPPDLNGSLLKNNNLLGRNRDRPAVVLGSLLNTRDLRLDGNKGSSSSSSSHLRRIRSSRH
mmetsp:Transcript_35725/g.86227  ORF Transcript_35725/g.86227 Transcript_35725/m.86227 type:complete len:252 (+) Transcript_35725:701-1456(+)